MTEQKLYDMVNNNIKLEGTKKIISLEKIDDMFSNDLSEEDINNLYDILDKENIEIESENVANDSEVYYDSDKNSPMLDGVKNYLMQIGQYPLLTQEEEIELSKKARQGNKMARDKLINSNLRLVVSIAKKYNTTYMTMDDKLSMVINHLDFQNLRLNNTLLIFLVLNHTLESGDYTHYILYLLNIFSIICTGLFYLFRHKHLLLQLIYPSYKPPIIIV